MGKHVGHSMVPSAGAVACHLLAGQPPHTTSRHFISLHLPQPHPPCPALPSSFVAAAATAGWA